MKKLLFLFVASLLVFTSCSKDDKDSSDPVSSILVKKIIYIGDKGLSFTDNVLYNGNKITSINGLDGSVYRYTYTGDQITLTEEIDKGGKLSYSNEYTYVNGKLSTSISKESGAPIYNKTKFVHNADETVSYEEFYIDPLTGIEETGGKVGKLTFKDGNLVKNENSTGITIYEYGTKNNPFNNVLGISLLLLEEGDEGTFVNDLIKKTYTSLGSGDNVYKSITTYAYKYNANDYPIEQVTVYQSGNSTSTETKQFVY